MRAPRVLTPPQKAAATREANAERKATFDKRHKENAPVRKAWKDVRLMIRGLGYAVRPRSSRRWDKRTSEQEWSEIATALERVAVYVQAYEIVRAEVRLKRALSKRTKVRKTKEA